MLPGTSHLSGFHIRLKLSGFKDLVLLPLLQLLLLLLLLSCLHLPLLCFEGRAEKVGELGHEVFVDGGKGEQLRSK